MFDECDGGSGIIGIINTFDRKLGRMVFAVNAKGGVLSFNLLKCDSSLWQFLGDVCYEELGTERRLEPEIRDIGWGFEIDQSGVFAINNDGRGSG